MATENNAPLPLDKTAVKRMERPHWVLDDAVYSISALLLSLIVMHSIWTLIIRPRAEAVLNYLVEAHGISRSLLSSVGVGERDLYDPANPTAEENRRARIIRYAG